MYKDPTEFRARFKAYKEGKMPYENGLPKYGNGTPGSNGNDAKTTYSDDEALAYIMALENPGRIGWDKTAKVWRPPTQKGFDHNLIAYGLDMREEHNPDVYNFLKAKGRLNNPYLTDQEAKQLMMKSYRTKDQAISKAIERAGGNVSQRGYNVMRAMAWHGHPMKMLLTKDSLTGKAFERAIARGDRDFDYVFDTYYHAGTNETKYAERIKADAKFRPKATTVKTGDGKIMYFDWGDQQPQWQPPALPKTPNTEYPIDRTAPESISSWSGADSPSKGPMVPGVIDALEQQLNSYNKFFNRKSLLPPLSSLMPSLDELMQEYHKNYVKDILDIENPFDDLFASADPFSSMILHARNGKLPCFDNGKSPIHIKPANRGKLTRLKARTGKSESELYNDGNPAHKKMVVFARNARKWKH